MIAQYERAAQPPTPDERVADLLASAGAPAEYGTVAGESAALAAFRTANQTTSPRPSRRSRMLSPLSHLTPFRTAAAAALGTGVLVTGGVAAAAFACQALLETFHQVDHLALVGRRLLPPPPHARRCRSRVIERRPSPRMVLFVATRTWARDAVGMDGTMARVRDICRDLPECEITGQQHHKIAVRRRTLGYHVVDHHGDGRMRSWTAAHSSRSRSTYDFGVSPVALRNS